LFLSSLHFYQLGRETASSVSISKCDNGVVAWHGFRMCITTTTTAATTTITTTVIIIIIIIIIITVIKTKLTCTFNLILYREACGQCQLEYVSSDIQFIVACAISA
jgi:hypothetical protein